MSGITTQLSGDSTSVQVVSKPSGMVGVTVALCPSLTGNAAEYRHEPAALHTVTPGVSHDAHGKIYPASLPVVDMQATDSAGKPIGGWAGRRLTMPVPVPPIPPPPGGIRYGLGLNSDDESRATEMGLKLVESFGVTLVRDEFDTRSASSVVAGRCADFAALGAVLRPLAGCPRASLPSAADAKGLAAWPKADPRITEVEFLNEVSYSYKLGNSKSAAEAYAVLAAEAMDVLDPLGVGLLVCAEDGGTGNSMWLDAMVARVPNILQRVAGVTIHPYYGGEKLASADGGFVLNDTYGLAKLKRLVAALARHTQRVVPIHATEWGEPTDNGRRLTNGGGQYQAMTYAEVAFLVRHHPAQLAAACAPGQLASLFFYQAHDQWPSGSSTDRERFFGAVKSDGSPKEPLTAAVRALLAS